MVNSAEVAQHNSSDDCWIVVHGKAYDVTHFLPDHPGGSAIILKYAGRDATRAFDPIHPKDIIEKLLPPSVFKGDVADAPSSVLSSTESPTEVHEEPLTEEDRLRQLEISRRPDLDQILNLSDFEAVAKRVMRKDGWAYYSSAADDEMTVRENRLAFHRIWLKPRVLVNVRSVDISSRMLGYPVAIPVYITATALGKLGHPDGEVVLTKAAYSESIVQMIPTLASCTLDEIVGARAPGQVQFFQLYVNANRTVTRSLVEKAERLGCKALFITGPLPHSFTIVDFMCALVDAPTLAKREKDMRMKYRQKPPSVQQGQTFNREQGAARAIASFIDPGLCWWDLQWFKSITRMPILLKGIQCGEDAVLAWQHGVAGIVVSNHGGRSGVEVLAEVMQHLEAAGFRHGDMEIYLDGGIRRGTDIFKALALGAQAVGIGRPFLYAMSAYGQAGVERAIQLLKDELAMVMRLMGVAHVQDIRRDQLVLDQLCAHIVPPKDYLAHGIYDRMQPPASRL